MNLNNNKLYCPYCNADLQGEEIPKELQKEYRATHFGRKIGIYDLHTDRTVQWQCPDCKGIWDRVEGGLKNKNN
jgi:hypothetical protein